MLDGPPVLPVPDVPLLAPLVGGALVVAASGRSRHRALAELLDLVPRQAILGVFLNEYAGAASKQRYGYLQLRRRAPARGDRGRVMSWEVDLDGQGGGTTAKARADCRASSRIRVVCSSDAGAGWSRSCSSAWC
ncbi:MAG: hypothetical protein R3E53_07400 [Myxococcota bacterium]